MKVDKIRQIVKLKHVMQRWKRNSLRSSRLHRRGFLAVYVGPDRRRFVIPTCFLKLCVFLGLLNAAKEKIRFPCDAAFFQKVLALLERDEPRFGRLGLEEFLWFGKSEPGYGSESSCKEETLLESQDVSLSSKKHRNKCSKHTQLDTL